MEWDPIFDGAAGISALAFDLIAFSAASFVLGCIVALAVHALFELGLRGLIQRAVVVDWFEAHKVVAKPDDIATAVGFKFRRRLFSLPYRQLCGQIASTFRDVVLNYMSGGKIQHLFDPLWGPIAFTSQGASDRATIERDLLTHSDNLIDELQSTLGRQILHWNYLASIMVSTLIITIIIIAPGGFQLRRGGVVIIVALAIISSFLSTIIQRILDRTISAR